MAQKNMTALAAGSSYSEAVFACLDGRREAIDRSLLELRGRADSLAAVATQIVGTLRAGKKVLVIGNGGSAAEAQHFAAELVGRFKRERSPYAVLALTTDTCILTAVGNDYGYAEVFARQVLALGAPGDLQLAYSTSGRSENLLRAASAGRERGMAVVAFTGHRPSPLEPLAHRTVRMPEGDTALTQELHTIMTHLLCDIVEAELAADEESGVR